MQNLLLPANDEKFVMAIAKSISRERLFHDTDIAVKAATGYSLSNDPFLLAKLEEEFEILWNGSHQKDSEVRQRFHDDALTAINAINLYLLTTVET